MIRALRATPVMPVPSLPAAPIVPAVCSPWPPETTLSSVGLVEAVAAVDVGDDGGRRAAAAVRGGDRVDGGAGDRAREAVDPGAGVAQAPQLGEERVVRDRVERSVAVGFGDGHCRVGFELPGGGCGGLARFHLYQLE